MEDLTHVIMCTFTSTKATVSPPLESCWRIADVTGDPSMWTQLFQMYPEGDGHPQGGWESIPMDRWLRGAHTRTGLAGRWQSAWEAGTLYTPYGVAETITAAATQLAVDFSRCVVVTNSPGVEVFRKAFPQIGLVTRHGGLIDVDSLDAAMRAMGRAPVSVFDDSDEQWGALHRMEGVIDCWARWVQLVAWASRPVMMTDVAPAYGQVWAPDANVSFDPDLQVTLDGPRGREVGKVRSVEPDGAGGVSVEWELNAGDPLAEVLAGDGRLADYSVELPDGPRHVDGCDCAGCVTAREDEEESNDG